MSTSVINLSGLDGHNGFRLDDGHDSGYSGKDVSGAGDVNGDGFDDVIVKMSDTGSFENGFYGSSYVVFGKTGGFDSSLSLSSLDGSNGFRLDESLHANNSGVSVSSAGDINGDGFDDVMIGADSYTTSRAGYVVFGKADGFNAALLLDNLNGSDGFLLDGVSSGSLGSAFFSVSSAGDINGDGFDDVIVGGVSQVGSFSSVVFGRASGFSATIDLISLDGTNGFRLSGAEYGGAGNSYDGTGYSVSGAGDVNGDGFGDLIVGAPFGDPNGDESGSGYVVFGKASGFEARLDPATLDGSNGFSLDGMAADDRAGGSVSTAGDVNGDGFDDVIIGARRADPNGNQSGGSSYLVFGHASGFAAAMDLSSLDGSNGFRIDGAAVGDASGTSVSNAGDINGDGFDDVIVGADGADPNGESSGSSYVVFGKASGFDAVVNLPSFEGKNILRLDGVAPGDRSGHSVSTAGDVNGDGLDDLIVGAPLSDSSYIIFGSRDFGGGLPEFLGTHGDDILRGTPIAEIFEAGDGNDVLIGGGGADIFQGGNGDDVIQVPDLGFQTLVGGAGTDVLELTGADIDLNLAHFHDALDSIETIDLTGSGDNTLTFTLPDFFSLSDSTRTFTINGNAGDRVIGLSQGWADDGIDGDYHIFSNRGTIVRIDLAVSADPPPPGVFNLSSLNGNNGFRVDGILATDFLGKSVSSAGDVNGDGLDDVIIGTPYTDQNGTASGSSYVVFGRTSGFDATLDPSSLNGSNGFRLNGAGSFDKSGRSVSSAGDVNGDGFDDVIIGTGDDFFVGTSYVVFGHASGFDATMELASLDGKNGFGLEGVTRGDSSGFSVSGAGDINGDGFDDVVVGAPHAEPNDIHSGSSYVVFGKATGFDARMDLSRLDGNNGFRLDGIEELTRSGYSVTGAGDINGDGFDDLIIGTMSISSYVVFGKASGFSASMSLSNLDGSNGFRLDDDDFFFGVSVSSAGDVNGDGLADLIVGTQEAMDGGFHNNSSYVVFGKDSGFDATLDLSSLNGSNGFRLVEAYTGYRLSVSDAGDFNGDGFGDLVVGSTGVSGYSDVSYVVFGKASGFDAEMNLSDLDGNNGLRLDGGVSGEFTHIAVSGAGDVNGDGLDDLIVGEPDVPSSGENSYSGSSYVIFGSRDFGHGGGGELPEINGTDGDDTLKGSEIAEHFIASDGNDNLLGRGGADVFDAGAGDDAIRIGDLTFASINGGDGNDALHLAGTDLNLDLTLLGSNIHGIETICLYGRGDNTLTLNADSLLNLSNSTNTLKVHGNSGDHITMQDSGWVDGGGSGFYHTYTHDDAVLLVGANVTVELV